VSPGQVEFWSTKSWKRTRVAANFVGLPYVGAVFQPDGRALWLAKNVRTARLYDLRTLGSRLSLPVVLLPLAPPPHGRYPAVSVDARRLQVWDLAQVRTQLRELRLDWTDARP